MQKMQNTWFCPFRKIPSFCPHSISIKSRMVSFPNLPVPVVGACLCSIHESQSSQALLGLAGLHISRRGEFQPRFSSCFELSVCLAIRTGLTGCSGLPFQTSTPQFLRGWWYQAKESSAQFPEMNVSDAACLGLWTQITAVASAKCR